MTAEATYTGKQHFPVEQLQSVMRYEDGRLFWTENASRRVAGKPVCQVLNRYGYFKVKYKGRVMTAHRVIWTLCHGRWPERVIDHINRIRTDNRIENLRDVTHLESSRNSVTWRGIRPPRSERRPRELRLVVDGWVTGKRDRWMAFIKPMSVRIYLGVFATKDEAEAAREGASRLLTALRSEALAAKGEPASLPPPNARTP